MDFAGLMRARCWLAAVLCMCVSSSFAGQTYYITYVSQTFFSSADAACKASVAPLGGNKPTRIIETTYCQYDNGGGNWFSREQLGQSSCPGSQVLINGACGTCPSGQSYDASAGKCDVVCPAAGTGLGGSSSSGVAVSGTSATTSGCAAGCGFTGSSGAYIPPGNSGSGNFIFGPYSSTGLKCDMSGAGAVAGSSSGSPGSGTAPPSPCGAGKCPGTINGQSVCVACGAGTQIVESGSSSSSSSSSATSASGVSSSSTSSGSGGKQTSCDGLKCTTTTTTSITNSDGSSSSSTSSNTEPQSDYCSKNPKAIACKGDDSQWGGACAAGFSCSGDAVQCAQAQASWKLACDMAGDPTDASVVAGKSAITAGDRPGDHPGKNPDNIQFAANIDQTNPYGDSCPPDFTVDVIGASVVVPLSHACDVLKWMGYVAVAFSMYGAARIAFGGVKGA